MKNNQKYSIEDYINKRFYYTTVIGEDYSTTERGYPLRKFKCLCDCGKEHLAYVGMLLSGRQKSCGCYKKIADKLPKSHGMSSTRPYSIWSKMINRITNPNDQRWPDYGGRGITVCERWKSFENFWNDMKEQYSNDLELDRIDVNGNYCPENCRWVSKSIQVHNKRKLADCESDYIGVTLDKRTSRWRSRICISKDKRKSLGTFNSEYQAALAYDNASEEIYGDRPNKTVREI